MKKVALLLLITLVSCTPKKLTSIHPSKINKVISIINALDPPVDLINVTELNADIANIYGGWFSVLSVSTNVNVMSNALPNYTGINIIEIANPAIESPVEMLVPLDGGITLTLTLSALE